jgi:hypothetical protein
MLDEPRGEKELREIWKPRRNVFFQRWYRLTFVAREEIAPGKGYGGGLLDPDDPDPLCAHLLEQRDEQIR